MFITGSLNPEKKKSTTENRKIEAREIEKMLTDLENLSGLNRGILIDMCNGTYTMSVWRQFREAIISQVGESAYEVIIAGLKDPAFVKRFKDYEAYKKYGRRYGW